MIKVKNDVVSMDWDAKGFIEIKRGKATKFIAAVHVYDKVPVIFKDGVAYTHFDKSVISFNDAVACIKEAVKDKDVDYPENYDDYVVLLEGSTLYDSNLELLGILDYKEDISHRLDDLSGYWHTVEMPMQ